MTRPASSIEWRSPIELLDVNVLVHAFRADAPDHVRFHDWLTARVNSERPFGVSDLALSGFLRVVTHPRVFHPPTPIAAALEFARILREAPGCRVIQPGPRHWAIFVDLCRRVQARGNLVPDAYFAALAVESGSVWVTTDRDYSRFPGLDWRHPFGST